MIKMVSKDFIGGFICLNVYGPTILIKKRELWQNITNTIQYHGNSILIFGRDFNATLEVVDKREGEVCFGKIQTDFQNFFC